MNSSPQPTGSPVTARTGVSTPLPGRGQITVVTELHGEAEGATACPAAPLFHQVLADSGLTVRQGAVTLSAPGSGAGPATVFVAPADGPDSTALAAAADPDDPEAVRAARDAVASVAAVRGPRTVYLASPRSFCAGVDRAIDVVDRLLEQNADADDPVYVRKQIVHNTHVVNGLAARGAVFVDELDEVPDDATVVFSAHGVSPQVKDHARAKNLRVVDATCPLVTKVHMEARRFAAEGDTVVLIGHAGHEEVEGTMGYAKDHVVLVETADDAERLEVPDAERVAYLTQTTLAVEETADTIAALKSRFPAAKGAPTDDICYATTNRQHAVSEIASRSDLVLVVGSPNSSNSVRLVELAQRKGVPAYLIDDARDIRLSWLEGVGSVGLTAGASAPPDLVAETIAVLSGLGPVEVIECTTTVENVYFAPPRAVRTSCP
ncbi:4-hydroxy-3-methylbut-2-enyl diphosphate reductase [Streptomyces sp. NPDC055749]